MKILILGIGNILMTDDGIGVRAIELMNERYRFPDEVTVLDGGTLGLSLLPHVQEVDRLLVLDAVDTGAAPGSIVTLTGDQIPPALDAKLSPHQLGLVELLTVASLLGSSPEETVLLGVQPESVRLGLELSASVESALEPLVTMVLDHLSHWGVAGN